MIRLLIIQLHNYICVCFCECVYQSHAEQPCVCPCDVVVDMAAVAQQLQQAALYVLSVCRIAALDQLLTTLQEGVHTARVHAHTLLEGLHAQIKRQNVNAVGRKRGSKV